MAEIAPERMPAGLLLASGMSRRFGGKNKLLWEVEGQSCVRRVALAFVRAGLNPIHVVVGHQAAEVTEALKGLNLVIVPNPDFAQGQSQALVRGVRSLPVGAPAAVIGVADQPFLSAEVIRHLIDSAQSSDARVVVPRYAGRRGNPVLFNRALFPELMQVRGDQGGREVLKRHDEEVTWVEMADDMAGADIDTMEDLAAVERAARER